MLTPVWLLTIGLGVGTFGTLVGAGGGFILVPLLALLEPSLPSEAVTAVSLAVVAMNAGSGAIAYARQRRIDLRSGIPFAIATLPGSIAGALLTRAVSRTAFDLIFALLLIGLAAFMVLSHDEGAESAPEGGGRGHTWREVTDRAGVQYRYRVNVPLGVALSVAVGFVSSFLGIGGGVIHVPAMIGLLGIPPHIATATSHFVLAIMATVGTATHVAAGDLSGLATQTLLLGAGAVVGAQIGARLSDRVHGTVIVRVLAVALVFVGVRLAVQAIAGV